MSGEPRSTPLRVNWTDVTPTLSDALADTVVTPLTVAPAAGAVKLTEGAAVSGVLLPTVTEIELDIAELPAASRATAWMVCEPLPALAVFHVTW